MKQEVIGKINQMGKAGEIIAKIGKIVTIIAIVVLLIGCCILAFIPKEAVSFTLNHHALAKVDFGDSKIFAMNESLITEDDENGIFEFDGVEYKTIDVTQDGMVWNADMESGEYTLYMRDALWIMIAAVIFMIVSAVVLHYIEKLCKKFRYCETPFTEEIALSLRKVAIALIPMAILNNLLENAVDGMVNGQVSVVLGIDLLSVLLIVVIFLLASIFRYGAILQQESDETL